MVKLFKNFKTLDWIFIITSFIFIVVQVWLDLKVPEYMSKITILVKTEGSLLSEIWKTGGYMLLCTFGSVVVSIIVGFFTARVAASFAQKVRYNLFSKVESFSLEEINRFSTPSLITRSTNDITQIQMFIAFGMQVLVKAPILATMAIIKIYTKSWQWTLTTGIAVIIMLTVITLIILFVLPKFKKIQELTDNLNRVTRENLTGIRVVRAYNAEEYEKNKFAKANEELTNTNLFVQRIMAIMNPMMSSIMSGISLAIYWLGAYIINNSPNPVEKIVLFGDMVVFSSYSIQIVFSFMMLTMIFIMLPRAQVSAKRINEVLDTKASIVDGKKNIIDHNTASVVEFKNVSFKYPDAEDYIIKDINFVANKGETVAFIGSTGSGKSTLINLIPRFYDVSLGEILIDGVNVKDYSQFALREKIGYVPQKAVIFSGTIESNVRLGEKKDSEQTIDDVKEALKIAQALDFVENMEGKLQAVIAQGGTNLSGGQKQRLAIARAIYRNPNIFIFDDSFSALDYKTERQLRMELKEKMKDKTILIVAQRIGTIKDADKIIVLDQGQVVGIGKHQELLKTCSVYQEIAYSQLSKEELENETSK